MTNRRGSTIQPKLVAINFPQSLKLVHKRHAGHHDKSLNTRGLSLMATLSHMPLECEPRDNIPSLKKVVNLKALEMCIDFR